MTDNTPVYNLKATIIETGLTSSTLRAWERRYDLIKPRRSPGGHRLYTRQEIEMLKWLVERQKEGLSISQAVEMWKTRQADKYLAPQHIPEVKAIPMPGAPMLDTLRREWLSACLDFDDLAASQVLDQAFASAAPETICIELLQKGLAQVGRGWYSGLYNVQQEHFTSALAMRRLNSLLAATQAPSRPQTILAVCPPGEEHDFILLMVTYLLRRKGWNVLYLGSDVPLENLNDTVNTTRPALVLSASQTLPTAASLNEMSALLHSQGIPLAFGGGIFTLVPEARRHISGYYLGTRLNMLPEIIELLIVAPPEMPLALPAATESLQTLASYNQYASDIQTQVALDVQGMGIGASHLRVALSYLTSMAASALKLGDIHLMDYAVVWVDGLLSNHGLPSSLSRLFYQAYRRAVEKYLAEQGRPILDWLDHAGAS